MMALAALAGQRPPSMHLRTAAGCRLQAGYKQATITFHDHEAQRCGQRTVLMLNPRHSREYKQQSRQTQGKLLYTMSKQEGKQKKEKKKKQKRDYGLAKEHP